MSNRPFAANQSEVLLQFGQSAFYRMRPSSRPPHVVKHYLNLNEAWWHLGLTNRTHVEQLVATFDAGGVACGGEHAQGPWVPDLWQHAQDLHDEGYEPLYRLVLEALASGDNNVEANSAWGDAGRLDHALLCITVIYDKEGRVRSAYRPHKHPVSSGLRAQQKNFVRAAQLRSSLSKSGRTDDGEKS